MSEGHPAFDFVAERAAKLICTTPEYDDLAREVGLRDHTDGVTEPEERARLRAEMDGRIAHLYGLTEDEFTHILATFPLVSQTAKDAALDAYRAYANLASQEADDSAASDDAVLRARIAGGETDTLEFKIGAIRNPYTGQPDNAMKGKILEEVVGFLNGDTGGTLLIGVQDNGEVIGIDGEIPLPNAQKPNLDGYGLWLAGLLSDSVVPRITSAFYRVSFPILDGKTLCRIDVQPAANPAYLRESRHDLFYRRQGTRCEYLRAADTLDYIHHRWPEIAGRSRPSDAPLDPSGGLFGNQTMLTMETPNTDTEAA